jgi:hypothetical protein
MLSLPLAVVANNPDGLVTGSDNNLYVASFNSNSVLRYDGQTGALLTPSYRLVVVG